MENSASQTLVHRCSEHYVQEKNAVTSLYGPRRNLLTPLRTLTTLGKNERDASAVPTRTNSFRIYAIPTNRCLEAWCRKYLPASAIAALVAEVAVADIHVPTRQSR